MQKVTDGIPHAAKSVIDLASVGVGVGSFLNWMPKIAALFTIIWLAIQIFTWFEKRVKARKDK